MARFHFPSSFPSNNQKTPKIKTLYSSVQSPHTCFLQSLKSNRALSSAAGNITPITLVTPFNFLFITILYYTIYLFIYYYSMIFKHFLSCCSDLRCVSILEEPTSDLTLSLCYSFFSKLL